MIPERQGQLDVEREKQRGKRKERERKKSKAQHNLSSSKELVVRKYKELSAYMLRL